MAGKPKKPPKPKGRKSAPRHIAKKSAPRPQLSKRLAAKSKQLLKDLPTETQMNQTIDRLARYSHQAVAVMGAAYLEHALGLYLRTVFKPMDADEEAAMFDGTRNGILSTFSAKIRMAYALGILHRNPYHAMLLINDIRNVFAHSLHRVTFRNKLVAEDCQKLAGVSEPLQMAVGLHPNTSEEPLAIYSKMVKALYYSLRLAIQGWRNLRPVSPSPSPSTPAAPSPPTDQGPHAGNDNRQ